MSSFKDRFLRRRTTLDDIPGYADGTLQDQLNREGIQSGPPDTGYGQFIRPQQQPISPAGKTPNQPIVSEPQINPAELPIARPTMADQYMASAVSGAQAPRGLRNVQVGGSQVIGNFPSGPSTYDPTATQTRDRRTQPRDFVSDDSQFLRDVENKPRSLRDKAGEVSQAIAISLGGKPAQTRRQRAIGDATDQLGRDLAIEKEQTARQMNELVPVNVPIVGADGSITGYEPRMVPRRTQGSIANQTAGTAQRGQRNAAYIGHLADIPAEKQSAEALKMWKAGLADGNPELKAEIAKRLKLPGTLPDSDKGTIEVDANGNYTVVHGRTATANQVTAPKTATDGTTAPAPVGAFKATALAERKRQFGITTAQRAELARLGRDAAMNRALVMAGASANRLGNPQVLSGIADGLESDADSQPNTKTGNASARSLREKAADIRKEASKAQQGQSGVVSPTQSAPMLKGRTMTKANLDRYKKDHGDAAAQSLLDSGVTIRQ